MAQQVKNLPETQEAQVPSLSWEDPLKESMATHSSILARKMPWTEEPGGLCGVTVSDTTKATEHSPADLEQQVLNFDLDQNQLQGLFEHRLVGPNLRVFDSVGQEWGLRIGISELLGDAKVAGPGHLQNHYFRGFLSVMSVRMIFLKSKALLRLKLPSALHAL